MKEFSYAARVMGCAFEVDIVTSSETLADALYVKALHYAQSYEKTFSRFLPESELSVLNITGECVPSARLLRVLTLAKVLSEETSGHFNPLVNIAHYGYTQSFENIENTHRTQSNAPVNSALDAIVISPQRITLGEGQRLDVAGFLKGYVAQNIAQTLYHENNAVTGVVINIGGDIATYGTQAHDKPFSFVIENPVTATDIPVPLRNASLATSGTYKRRWICDDKPVHHILDPATHITPQSDLISASVILPDGARSDAFATVAIILGSTRAHSFLKRHGASFVLITHDGKILQHVA